MKKITIIMRLFGSFRSYGDSITLSIPAGRSVLEIKTALRDALGIKAESLISDSVIANDETVLPGSYVIDQDVQLSILPPVCGG